MIAVDDRGAAGGIRLGMQRREAEGVCPSVVTLPADPGADAARFEPVVVAVEELVPRVESVEPGLLLVPVGGAIAYYGGEAVLVARIVARVEAAVPGADFRFGLAAGPFAARWAAKLTTASDPVRIVEDDASFLASLDISAVERDELADTFRWLGITTLGSLARLPRPAVVSRFGVDGLDAHRIAAGEDRAVAPRAIPADPAVEERFSPPIDSMERAAFAARSLANELIVSLAAHGVAPYRVVVEAEAADGSVRSRTWRSADPFDDATLAERVRWQLRAWIDGTGIRGGLRLLRLVPGDLSDTGRQMALHEDAAAVARVRRALTEVQAILGSDALLQARPQGGRDPGEQVAWHRWDEHGAVTLDPDAPWPGRIPAPSPALVPPEPRPLAVEWDGGLPARVRLASRWEPVLSWAGPWRRTGRWWDGEGSADRYQLVTSAGAFLCEVRPEGTWLVGIYD